MRLRELGPGNQKLVVNTVFDAATHGDIIADSFDRDHSVLLAMLPPELSELPRSEVPLRSFGMVGLPLLPALLCAERPAAGPVTVPAVPDTPSLLALVDELAKPGDGHWQGCGRQDDLCRRRCSRTSEAGGKART